MGKILKWGVLPLLVLIVALTITFGLFFEKHFDDAHQRFADQYDMEYSKPRNNRGLFTSDVEVCFRPRYGVLANGASLCAAYAIQYGPILWHGGLNVGWMSARITPRWPAEFDALLKTVFGKEAPLQLALQARFADQLYVLVETPELNVSDTQKFAMEPLRWHNWIDLAAGHYRTEGSWPSAQMEAPIAAQLSNLRFDGEFTRDSSQLWLGNARFTLDAVKASNNGINLFDLQHVEYDTSNQSNSNPALSDHRLSLKWQRLQVAQQIPTQADIQLTIAGLNKQALQQLQMLSQSLSGHADDAVTQQGMVALQQLVNAGLTLRIDRFDISSDSVHARGKGEFVLPASEAPDAVATALQRIDGQFKWSLPLGLVNQWVGHDTIQQWLGDKRVWLEGNLVHFALTMKDGTMHLGLWRVPLPGSEPPADVTLPETGNAALGDSVNEQINHDDHFSETTTDDENAI